MSSEPKEHNMQVALSRVHNLRRKILVVHGIGEPLRFQTQPCVLLINRVPFPDNTFQQITRVELNTWLVRPQLHLPPGHFLRHDSGFPEMLPHNPVDDVVDVVPAG